MAEESVNDKDKRVGMQVLELCIDRDRLNELFDRGGGTSLILLNFLCVIYSQYVFMYIILLNYFNIFLVISMDIYLVRRKI